MQIQQGLGYHIQDAFFREINDPCLMSNKENQHYRPHFLALADIHNPNIYWMIPISSQYSKYQSIVNNQIQRYGKCTKIVLASYAGQDAAFLIQNAFPIISLLFLFHVSCHLHTKMLY